MGKAIENYECPFPFDPSVYLLGLYLAEVLAHLSKTCTGLIIAPLLKLTKDW